MIDSVKVSYLMLISLGIAVGLFVAGDQETSWLVCGVVALPLYGIAITLREFEDSSDDS